MASVVLYTYKVFYNLLELDKTFYDPAGLPTLKQQCTSAKAFIIVVLNF